jgi:integrase
VLSDAIEYLTGLDQPTSPAELIDRCIRKWEPGSRTRQERARNLCQFLRHCTSREQMPVIWQPPSDLKGHIGRKPASATSQKSAPITDDQIIDLLASLPDDAAGQRWADAIKLIAELGLRPIELQYLTIKIDPKTKEMYWWCSYEKRAGEGVTKPRRLYRLPLSKNSELIEWNLINRWKKKQIELPSLNSGNGAADAIATYLNRRDGWKTLKAEAEAMGERVSCYSLRHSYSVRGHQRGIDNGSMALAMGHSIEVHCRSYPWATEAGAAAAFAKAEKQA